jgi:ACDE family multidrug resistance protein
MRRIYFPVLLKNLGRDQASTFVTLFSLETASRALMIAIVPLEAYRLLGSAFLVSLVYFATSGFGLAVSIFLPTIIHRITRRWAVTIGALCYAASAMLYLIGQPATLIAGLALQVVGVAMLEIVVNLYVLDNVPRRELNSFEPRRMFYTGMTFIISPGLGVYLHTVVMPGLTFICVAVCALALLAYFWHVRLSDNGVLQRAKAPPPKPIQFIPRFAKQKRLRLAWVLAVGRSSWWIMYFVYMPIQAKAAGFADETIGILVSAGMIPMFLIRVWARIAKHKGIRPVLMFGYAAADLATLCAGLLAGGAPQISIVFLLLAALFATVIDGAGNVPFLRAVHPFERESMTSVYMTFRHTSSLLTPGLFAVVLAVAPLPMVFVASAGVGLAMARLSRFVPRKL